MVNKLTWGILAIIYAPFFKKFSFPSHIGIPKYTLGLNRVSVGKKVRFMPGLRLETHKNGSISFEDGVSVGHNFHIVSAGNLIIKRNTTISGNVLITNLDHDYKQLDTHILKQKMIVSETVIGENCFIGYGAAIQAGTILGRQCIVGANSVVKGIFPDYSVIAGAPGRIIKRFNFETSKWEKTNKKGEFL
jgi:acetyltransferase-like isoleucine patch superfamily enzyme